MVLPQPFQAFPPHPVPPAVPGVNHDDTMMRQHKVSKPHLHTPRVPRRESLSRNCIDPRNQVPYMRSSRSGSLGQSGPKLRVLRDPLRIDAMSFTEIAGKHYCDGDVLCMRADLMMAAEFSRGDARNIHDAKTAHQQGKTRTAAGCLWTG